MKPAFESHTLRPPKNKSIPAPTSDSMNILRLNRAESSIAPLVCNGDIQFRICESGANIGRKTVCPSPLSNSFQTHSKTQILETSRFPTSPPGCRQSTKTSRSNFCFMCRVKARSNSARIDSLCGVITTRRSAFRIDTAFSPSGRNRNGVTNVATSSAMMTIIF